MWSGDPEQAKLVRESFDPAVEQHGLIGQEFKVVLYFAAIEPNEGIEPLQDQRHFRRQDIQGVAPADMDLLMDQYLLVGFRVVQTRVDENVLAERAGRTIAAGLYDAVPAVTDDRLRARLAAEYCNLQNKMSSEEANADEIAVKERMYYHQEDG